MECHPARAATRPRRITGRTHNLDDQEKRASAKLELPLVCVDVRQANVDNAAHRRMRSGAGLDSVS